MKKPILVTRSSLPPMEEYIDEIRDIWESHWLTNMGEKHQALQEGLKKYLGVECIDLFTTGHMALELSLQALNLQGEVITTPFTFASTTHAIVRNGLTPVFCDIRPDDFTMDADKIESLITDRTCAIMPVHVYGNVCDVEKIQKAVNMEYDQVQAEAIRRAATAKVLVLTGGPGTGKTTTTQGIIAAYRTFGLRILLAAPTGRAAKRMTEAGGYEAQTIHRMLEISGGVPDGDRKSAAGLSMFFERNEDNPLEADVIIVDEMSMVDLPLMYALLNAIVPGTRVILVGDVNQLPSVGPGSVLKDIIDSNEFHTVKLTKIFRQASTSDIIVNAHKINRGEPVSLDNKSMDFFFLKRYEADKIINVTLQLIKQKLPKFVGASEYDIQVLTPMRKGLLGVERLNGILQMYLNPADKRKREKEHGGTIFREGDKVMQTKNNYQLEWEIRSKYGLCIDKGTGIFNGDMGIIEEINDFAETMTVSFDEGRMVEYPYKLLDELELAYAVTIHKSQGSEYPAVVIPLLSGPRMLMNRNLLYTAVTRAKKCVTIVGNDITFNQMIENNSQLKRYSGLRDRLTEDSLQ